MNFIWVFLIAFIINVTKASNLVDVKKESKPLYEYIIAKRLTIGLFPTLPNIRNKFIVILKPLIEAYREVTQLEQYKKPLMRQLSIKYINLNSNDKIKDEITTRRSLMQTKKFTIRPHDVYAESVSEKYNWNSKIKTYNSRITKNERNIGKSYYKTNKEKSRLLTPENNDISQNYFESKERFHQNRYVQDSRKLKNLLLFPKRNSFNGNPEQRISKPFEINRFDSETEVPSRVVKNGTDGVINEKKETIKVPPNVFIKSDSKDQSDEIVGPEENVYDLEGKDQYEFISAKGVNEMSADFADDKITTDTDIEYSVSRPKRSVNIIEEESVPTTFAGIKITDQEYPISHDLTFKNIHT